MSWRESCQILRVQIEPMRLKIRRRGKLSMLDLGLLRNWALLFVYTGPFQTRAALHSFWIFLEAVKVDFFFFLLTSTSKPLTSTGAIAVIIVNMNEGLNMWPYLKENSDSTVRKFYLPFPLIAYFWPAILLHLNPETGLEEGIGK